VEGAIIKGGIKKKGPSSGENFDDCKRIISLKNIEIKIGGDITLCLNNWECFTCFG